MKKIILPIDIESDTYKRLEELARINGRTPDEEMASIIENEAARERRSAFRVINGKTA